MDTVDGYHVLAGTTPASGVLNGFDGHNDARSNMLSALMEGTLSGDTETQAWKLADNSVLTPCTYSELSEAHALAIREKGRILFLRNEELVSKG